MRVVSLAANITQVDRAVMLPAECEEVENTEFEDGLGLSPSRNATATDETPSSAPAGHSKIS